LTAVTVVQSAVVGPTPGSKEATATCATGRPISGGYVTSGTNSSIKESRPSDAGTGWTVVANPPTNGNASLQAYVVCVTVAAP